MLSLFSQKKNLIRIGKDRLQFGVGACHRTLILNGYVRVDFETDKSGDIGAGMGQLILFIIALFQCDEQSFALFAGVYFDCYR